MRCRKPKVMLIVYYRASQISKHHGDYQVKSQAQVTQLLKIWPVEEWFFVFYEAAVWAL